MPQFDDLISDLLKENLLDDTFASFKKVSNEFDTANYSNSQTFIADQYNDSFDTDLELPDHIYVLKENNTISVNIKDEFSLLPFSSESTENALIEDNIPVINNQIFSNPLRKKIKRKLNGKYCPKCRLKHPYIQVKCQFCNSRILSNLYYYPLILVSLLLFITVIGLFIVLKSPS